MILTGQSPPCSPLPHNLRRRSSGLGRMTSSSSSRYPAISLGFAILLLVFLVLLLLLVLAVLVLVLLVLVPVLLFLLLRVPAVSLGFTILLLLLRAQPYLWVSPFVFFCVPSFISGSHHSYSSSAFPSYIFELTRLLILLLGSQL